MKREEPKTWSPSASHVWASKYRYDGPEGQGDKSVDDTWKRVAHALAGVEPANPASWERKFEDLMKSLRFLPGGRIIAGAGTEEKLTLHNCFVMGELSDDSASVFSALREGAATMQMGGGVGYDFSTLRPESTELPLDMCEMLHPPRGPVAYMHVWETMCNNALATGVRRGAMMATLRCDHPDIEKFVDAKKNGSLLGHFNISVLVSDGFLDAVREGRTWPLVFPVSECDDTAVDEIVMRQWPGRPEPQPCRVYRRVWARDLWDRMLRSALECGEPGVLFIDTINRKNNLWYREQLTATNPCGEVPLPPYGACDLGSLNLTQYVSDAFTPDARIDLDAIGSDAAVAVRMLDNAIDLSLYPLEAQRIQAKGTRRIGLGLTGLGDALAMLNKRYDEADGREVAASVARVVCHSAYRASIALAQERGPFPFLDVARYLEGEFIRSLPEDIRSGIQNFGIRNSHLIAIAPTGSISLLAGNVSSGIEPIFATRFRRRVVQPRGRYRTFDLTDYAFRRWCESAGRAVELPATFVEAQKISARNHLLMQGAVQQYVDNSISKTINLPETATFGEFRSVFEEAHELGLKGCTVFRADPRRNSVVVNLDTEIFERKPVARACVGERLPEVGAPLYMN